MKREHVTWETTHQTYSISQTGPFSPLGTLSVWINRFFWINSAPTNYLFHSTEPTAKECGNCFFINTLQPHLLPVTLNAISCTYKRGVWTLWLGSWKLVTETIINVWPGRILKSFAFKPPPATSPSLPAEIPFSKRKGKMNMNIDKVSQRAVNLKTSRWT